MPTPTGPATTREEIDEAESRAQMSAHEFGAERGRAGVEAQAFWRDELAGFEGVTSLGLDRPAAPTRGRAEATQRLAPALLARLRERALAWGVSVEALVQTAWCVLVARYGNARDVLVGAARAGGMQPLRVRFAADASVLDCARSVERQNGVGPHAEAWAGLDAVDTQIEVRERVVLERESGAALRRPDVAVHAVVELTAEPAVGIDFDAARIEPGAASRIAAHLVVLLDGIAGGTARDALALPLLDAGERHTVLVAWNDTRVAHAAGPAVHARFEARARSEPDAIAVRHGTGQLTYRELDARADALARVLRSRGPVATVAVCLERSLAMPVAVLAVLKAGAAYVPLAPEYPRDRLAYMLREAGVAVLLTERSLASSLGAVDARVVLVDDVPVDAPAFASPSLGADDLAYVIFTSGSTGRPKGVAMRHGALTNLLAWQRRTSAVREGGRTLQFAPLSFDVSFQEMFATWSAGGTLVLLSDDERRDPAALLDLLVRQRVNRLFLPFVALQKLAEAVAARADVADLALREVITAGEALRVSPAVRAMFARLAGCALENQYGPSETHVVTSHRLAGAASAWPDLPPIGRPIDNTVAYVLDAAGQPSPIGVPGELFVGGACLARGYLGRDELTAERFVRDPFAREAGARMYRTGDVVRWRADGEIEFLGRADHQVKIRGHRVEPGEVEAVLGRCAGVGRVAVVARDDASGGKRLVAYVVAAEGDGAAPSADVLRAYALERLPEYMVPTAFVPLASLPLAPSGKVDTKALPAPDYDRHGLHRAYAPPRTREERVLVDALASALRLGRVGIDDDFFELGGDSLRGIGVLTRARAGGLALSLRQLFEHTTPRRLALALRDAAPEAHETLPSTTPFSLLSRDDRARLPAGLDDAYPLTALQAGMLFHADLGEGAGVYHEVFSYPLSRAPDLGVLQTALDQLVASHPALRTTFDLATFSEPLQLVHHARATPLHIAPPERLEPWALAERRRGFDLARGDVPVRFFVHASGYFSVSLQHALLDGWSVASMVTELLDRYRALERGAPRAVEAPSVAFRDFIAVERDAAASDDSRAFWSAKLDEAVVATVPRATHLGGAPEAVTVPREARVALGEDAVAALTQLAREAGAPLKSALLAAHLRVTALISGQADVVTGVVTNGRPEARDGDRALGLYLNTVPLRQRVDAASWPALIAATFAAEREAMPHRRYPLAQLARQRGSAPFETAFNFMHFHVYDARAAGVDDLRAGEPRVFTQTSFALTADFTLRSAPDGRGATLELCVGIGVADVSLAQAEAIAGYYARTLEAMVREPARAPDRQDVLAADERHAVLYAWNDTRRPDALRGVLHHGFETHAARTPDALAVVSGGASITYGALEARANRLARALVTRGVGRGARVALCIARSIDLVVAILAVEKAGGAYVPLDTTYPTDRIGYIVENSGASLVVSHARFAERLPSGVARLLLDEAHDEIELEISTPIARTNGPDDLAYVIYTSGSTGRPKGVMVRHSAATNLVRWVNDTFAIGARDRVLAVSSICFDLSVYDVFGLLDAGGAIQMCTEDEVRDPDALLALLRREPVTFWNSAPAMLQQLVPLFDGGADHGAEFEHLRLVFLSGDWIPVSLPDAIRGRFPRADVISLGGATEAAIWSNWFAIDRVEPRWPSIPYGRPIPNARYYVLDAHQQPAPVGVRGELFIAGPCLADGYAGRDDLTAERFVADPYAPRDEPDAKMYRTGDLARFFDDGNLEFLGRADQQVKIRGYRVELGEIETVLARHAAVASVAVVVRDDPPRGKQLVAYCVPRDGAALSVSELGETLRSAVPEYMIPGAWVVLEALPLTPNGKLDRRALPAPDAATVGAALGDDERPRTATEVALAELWREALGVDAVGLRSGFFELGGHSLLATQLVARARRVFACDVPLRALFEAPTLGALAARIDALRAAPVVEPHPLRAAIARPDEDIPLTFAQERIAFMHALEPRSSVYNICVGARLTGPLDLPALTRALDALVARHAPLRTRLVPLRDRVVQRVAPSERVALSRHDLRALPDDARATEAARLIALEADAPFDLEAAPPFRATLICLEDSRAELLLTVHHVAADGWSLGVMLRDLAALYAGEPLAPLALEYADYALWQRAHRDAFFEAHLPYWKTRLEAAPLALELPTDRPRPAVQTFRGAFEPIALPRALCQKLEALGRTRGATLFMTVLAGLQVLLARYSGQRDLVVGTPVANRTDAALDELVGCFINVLPLRADLSDDPSFGDLVARARETTLGAVAHQELPFEKMVEALAVARDPSRSPVFQVMLSYQGAQARTRTAGALSIEQVEHEAPVAKYDLTLALEEQRGALEGVFEYNTDLFDRATIARMGTHLRALLEGAVQAPSTRVSVLPLLDAAEKHTVLVAWNATAADYPRDACIHELIEAQVARDADAPAAILDDARLSYGELNRRANRVAHRLRALGVGPGSRVGIYTAPTEAALVAIVGVLKSGGAYVPLDAASPDDRVQFVVRDAGLGVVVSEPALLDALAPMDVRTVVIGVDDAHGDDANPARIAGPNDLAYVIYTSGSTGQPKGVMVTHGNLVHSTTARFRHYREPVARYLMIWSFAFDSAVAGTFWTLCQGGALLLPSEALRGELPALLRWMGSHAVSHTDVIPSMYALMLAAAAPRDLASLRVAIVGGEACPRELVAQHAATVPHAELHNEYGPTEATVWATAYAARDTTAVRGVPIGRPISNARAYVLDAQREPVPVGVLGELYLGGDGIARGYLGRDDLTAERFVPDPFAPSHGARMYRTGDLARWLASGELEFAGRADHQVKVRGYRVELGEVEEAMLRVPGVRLAAVLARDDAARGTRLVAYLEAASEIEDQALRDALRETLPAYMVPSVLVRLDRLPRNANGKVDRRALADRPLLDDDAPRGEIAQPRNPTERLLAGIWAAALGVSVVGIHDDFFALGGHSLLMLSIIARAAHAGLALRPEQLFQHPTIARLASVVRTESSLGRGDEAWSSLVTLQPRGSKPPLFLVHATPGDLFGYVNLVDELGPDQPCYGFQSLGLHAVAQSHTSIESMAAYYVARLREFQPRGPYYLGGWCYGGVVAYEMARALVAQGERVPLIALIDAVAPRPSLAEYGYYVDRVRGLLGLGVRGLPRFVLEKARSMREDAAREDADRLLVTIPTGPLANREHVLGVNMVAMERYRTRPLDARIALFAPAHASGSASLDRGQGWTRLVASIERYDVPGSHDTALQSPHAAVLADKLREAIERARRREAGSR